MAALSLLSAPTGIINFASGKLLGGSKATLTGGDSSLIILPAGTDPQTQFASLASSGIVHVAGSSLSIPAGKSIVGTGTIPDHLDLAGSLSGASYPGITLARGLTVSGSGSLNSPFATVNIDDLTSGISGGQISISTMNVGAAGKGAFTQSGGKISLSTLTIGKDAESDGVYTLFAGQLNTSYTNVGSSGAGRLVQFGGSHAASTLKVNPLGSLILSGGALQVSSSTTVNGGSASWQAGQFSTRSLTLDGGAMELSPGGDKLLKLTSLTLVNSATLDLADNAMILQPDTASPQELIELISAQIGAARNAERLWQGPGISSSTAREDASGLYGLAAILNRDSQGKPVYSIFQGQAVDANSILVRYTLNGDADLNGKLDGSDYFFIDKGFLSRNSANPLSGYRNGDFDYNGTIDGSDYFLIDKAFLAQRGSAAVAAPAVPEPGMVGLALAAASLILLRRRG